MLAYYRINVRLAMQLSTYVGEKVTRHWAGRSQKVGLLHTADYIWLPLAQAQIEYVAVHSAKGNPPYAYARSRGQR